MTHLWIMLFEAQTWMYTWPNLLCKKDKVGSSIYHFLQIIKIKQQKKCVSEAWMHKFHSIQMCLRPISFLLVRDVCHN